MKNVASRLFFDRFNCIQSFPNVKVLKRRGSGTEVYTEQGVFEN